MAKISQATIVIEAGENSGVKHQCSECLRNDKTLIFSKLQVDKNYKWVSLDDVFNHGDSTEGVVNFLKYHFKKPTVIVLCIAQA